MASSNVTLEVFTTDELPPTHGTLRGREGEGEGGRGGGRERGRRGGGRGERRGGREREGMNMNNYSL